MDIDEFLRTAELPNVVVDTDRALGRAVHRGQARRRRHVAVAGVCVVVLVTGSAAVAWSTLGDDDTAEVSAGAPPGTPQTPEAGDVAVWTIDPVAPPSPEATSFAALVTRLGCNSGVTGKVLTPGVAITNTQIVVTFTVETDPDGGRCPSNDVVPYEVDLSQPIGGRALVDGSCRTGGDAATTSFCTDDGGIRWGPGDEARDDELPGERLDRFPVEGAELAVVGVAAGEVLNVRSGPGTAFDVVAELAPLAVAMVASGHNRQLDDGSVWVQVTVGEVTTGWVNTAFTAHLGPVTDITAEVFADEGPLRAATLPELADLVARRAEGEAPGDELIVVVVDVPAGGDLAEIVVDVLGYLDDSGLGVRLHVFAEGDGGGFALRAVEARSLCRRGASDEGCL